MSIKASGQETAEQKHEIRDEGSLHKYRTEIPNTVVRGRKAEGLSAHAKWFYVYLKSVIGDDGVCFRSTSTMAKESGMSRAQVSASKKALAKTGLIVVVAGKNPRRDADRISIKDIWLLNVQEFSVHHMNTDDEAIIVDKYGNSMVSVHHMNTGDGQCSPYEHKSSPYELSVQEVAHKKIPLRRSPEEEKEESLSEILCPTVASAFVQDGPYTPWDATLELPETTPPKKKKVIRPLADDDWLRALLLEYTHDFDFDALNDDAWWINAGNSFSTFSASWVSLAFASLAGWLQDNPARRPRTPMGWKKRMKYSLGWYYDKHLRRESYGTRTTRPNR